MPESSVSNKELPQSSVEKPTPRPKMDEKAEKNRLEKFSKGFRIALAGAISGAWSLGVAISYAESIDSDRYQTSYQSAVTESPNHLDAFTLTQSQILTTFQKPLLAQAETSQSPEKDNLGGTEQVHIEPRTIVFEEFGKTINSLQSENAIITDQLNTQRGQSITQAQKLRENLANMFDSQKEKDLVDRTYKEVSQAMKILERIQFDQRDLGLKNLQFAQDQKNLIQHHYASLHHDLEILQESIQKNQTVDSISIETLQEHALERPKWLVKYWQLEQDRANLNFDPGKDDSTPEGKAYREWVQNELNEALIGQQIYLSPESFVETAEGILLNTVLSVHELSSKSRSQEVEVQELKIIKDFLDRFPISDNQKIRYLYIYMYRGTWGEFTKFQNPNTKIENYDFQFNIFGDISSERRRRLELAIDELKSSVEKQQNAWAKERIATYKQLYSLTKTGQTWFDTIDFRQAVGKPWEFLAGGGSARVSQSSEIYACLAEIGHVYFQRHPFNITGHPELKWDDGNSDDPKQNYNKEKDSSNISLAYNQFRRDIDEFVALKDAGDAEPLRRWLASWPDYHMAEMAMPVTATGGNIRLFKNTPFEKYFDQLLSNGEFQSYGELASWYRTLSKENQISFIKYFEPTLLPFIEEVTRERPSFLVEITPDRKTYLDSVFARKKSLVEHEEKQSLVDFGDQFHLYIDNNQLIDINPLYKSIWTDYINRIKLFYMKYSNLLRESHPSAYNFLQRSVKKTT